MPFVRIDMVAGRYDAERRAALGDAVYQALRSIGVPEGDRFQVLTEKPQSELVYDRAYLGIERSDGFVAIQITLNAGRTLQQKRALYRAIADGLAAHGVRRQDVLINLVETAKENWSFGNGEAQYAEGA